MYKLFIGIVVGAISAQAIALYLPEAAEGNIESIIHFGVIAISIITLLVTVVAFAAPYFARRYFRNLSCTIESGIAHLSSSAENLLNNNNSEAIIDSKNAALEIAGWYTKSLFRASVTRTAIAILVAFGGLLGTAILIRQNNLFKAQNELQNEQTKLLNKQNEFLQIQTELQRLQTTAARFEQYNNISKEIKETRLYASAVAEILHNLSGAKNFHPEVAKDVFSYGQSFEGVDDYTSRVFIVHARVAQALTVEEFRIKACSSKPDHAAMSPQPCSNANLKRALTMAFKRDRNQIHTGIVELLSIYSNGRLKIKTIMSPLETDQGPRGEINLVKANKQCRSDWDPSMAQYIIAQLEIVHEMSGNVLRHLQYKSNFENAFQNSYKLFQALYELGVRHEIFHRRFSITDSDNFDELDLYKMDLIIGMSYSYLDNFISGLDSHCTKTISALQKMSDEMDPLKNSISSSPKL